MAPIAPEPVLDVVRALSTVASFTIVVQQLKVMYDTFFVSVCERCRGTGMVTCPHCHGTKDLRRRPAMLLARGSRPALLDAAKTHYECFHCGPLTKYDIDPYAPEDEEMETDALMIMDNLKAAVANIWPKPHQMPIYAGTIACPDCHGNPQISRFTPDFGRALDLDGPWDRIIRRRMGRRLTQQNTPAEQLPRPMLEWPGAPPVPPPPPKTPEQLEAEAAEEVDDPFAGYLVRFVSDDESDDGF